MEQYSTKDKVIIFLMVITMPFMCGFYWLGFMIYLAYKAIQIIRGKE